MLSLAGRAILVRAALRTLPIYAMSALLLPSGTLLELDKRCRTFFWSGQDSITGGQCKVAWDLVCAPFSNGGLGFSSLRHMNLCLLLKHLSKLHDHGHPLAPTYLVNKYGWSPTRDLGPCDNSTTPVWRDILKGLDFFRFITTVRIGNGTTTSFWHGLWLPSHQTTLASQFPAIYSHSNRQCVSVARVLASPELNLDLAPRLSHVAELELLALHAILATVNLNS